MDILKIGMYARVDGEIGKVVKICTCEQCKARGYFEPVIEYKHKKTDYVTVYWKDNLKASYNIIDLIEVGDYVNGRQVVEVREHLHTDEYTYRVYCLGEWGILGKNDIEIVLSNGEFTWSFSKNESDYKIKSIVTKEQFESISYKVVE